MNIQMKRSWKLKKLSVISNRKRSKGEVKSEDEAKIKYIFDEVLVDEKEEYESDFYIGPRFVLYEGHLEQFMEDLTPVLDEIDDHIIKGNYESAFRECQLVLRESVIILSESEYDDLNSYLRRTLKLCENYFHRLFSDNKNSGLIKVFIGWFISQCARNEFNQRNIIDDLIELYSSLEKLPSFSITAQSIIKVPVKREKTSQSVIKLFHYCHNNRNDEVLKLLEVNESDEELSKRYVNILLEDNKYPEALDFSRHRLSVFQETDYEGIDQHCFLANNDGYTYWVSYREWYCKLIIELLTKLNEIQNAIEFVALTYINRKQYSRQFRLECYELLAKSLSSDLRSDLFNSVLKNESGLLLNDIEQICVIENKWVELLYEYRRKGNFLGNINESFSKHREHLCNYPAEAIDMYICTIYAYTLKDSGSKGRLLTIRDGFINLLSIPGSESSAIELLFKLHMEFFRRRTLIESLDVLIYERGLSEKYREFEEVNLPKPESEINKKKDNWTNNEWAENRIRLLREKNILYEVFRNWPGDMSVLPAAQAEELLFIYSGSVLAYIEKNKDNVATKYERITESFKVVKDSINDINVFLDKLFEIILTVQIKFSNRKNLVELFEKYINDNGLTEKYCKYSEGKRSKLESETIKLSSERKNDSWGNREWAENEIRVLREKNIMYEVIKNWPGDISVLTAAQIEELLFLYKESVFAYIEKDHDNVSTKFRRIAESFDAVSSSIQDKNVFHDLLFELILTSKIRFKKRTNLVELFEKYINDNGLSEKYNEFSVFRLQKIESETIKPGPKRNNNNWKDNEWAENEIRLLREKNIMFDVVKNWPYDMSLLPTVQSEQLLKIYKKALFVYIERNSDNLITKFKRIRESFDVIKGSINDINVFQKLLFEWILTIVIQFSKRQNLIELFEDYINDSGLSENYNDFSRQNRSDIEAETKNPEPERKRDNWEDAEWADNQLGILSFDKSLYDIRKNWPDNFSNLPEKVSKQLLELYRVSVIEYAARSTKPEKTKSEYLCRSLEFIKEQTSDNEFITGIANALKERFPNRSVMNDRIGDYLNQKNLNNQI